MRKMSKMNNSSIDRRTTEAKHGPPMPQTMVKIVNPLVKAVLLSPFHKGMSKRLMVLSFTGKKTGKRYATPVGYVRQGNRITIFTHSAWHKNFKASAPVRMRIQGQDVHGTATLVTDPGRIKQMVRILSAANGEAMTRRMGFWVDDLESAGPDSLRMATQGVYFIEIETGKAE